MFVISGVINFVRGTFAKRNTVRQSCDRPRRHCHVFESHVYVRMSAHDFLGWAVVRLVERGPCRARATRSRVINTKSPSLCHHSQSRSGDIPVRHTRTVLPVYNY